MNRAFKDKVVLVSGEVNTLSMEIIHSFLKETANVIFPAKNLQQIHTIKSFRDINQYKNLITLIVDIQDFDKVEDTCETITEKFGKIDLSIELPGFTNCQKDLTEASIDEWNNMMETDMLPFFIGARVVLNMMKGNLNGMFVHISDSRFFENFKSCGLARVAFSSRIEMSRIFAEEAYRSGIRYYHLWAQNLVNKENLLHPGSVPVMTAEGITAEIMKLYYEENYSMEMAIQSFPEKLLHQQV